MIPSYFDVMEMDKPMSIVLWLNVGHSQHFQTGSYIFRKFYYYHWAHDIFVEFLKEEDYVAPNTLRPLQRCKRALRIVRSTLWKRPWQTLSWRAGGRSWLKVQTWHIAAGKPGRLYGYWEITTQSPSQGLKLLPSQSPTSCYSSRGKPDHHPRRPNFPMLLDVPSQESFDFTRPFTRDELESKTWKTRLQAPTTSLLRKLSTCVQLTSHGSSLRCSMDTWAPAISQRYEES